MSKGNKICRARKATGYLLEALLSLGNDEFEKQLKVVEGLTKAIIETGRGELRAPGKSPAHQVGDGKASTTPDTVFGVNLDDDNCRINNALPMDVVPNAPSISERKSPVHSSGDAIEGFDDTFLLQNDVKIRKYRIRTSVRNRIRTFGGLSKNQLEAFDSSVCIVCQLDEPADKIVRVVDWISCDRCSSWFHNVCCNYSAGSPFSYAHCEDSPPMWKHRECVRPRPTSLRNPLLLPFTADIFQTGYILKQF
jgi:hypothetical protein